MPRMTPADGRLVSFESKFDVQIETNAAGAELWVAKIPFNQTIHEQQFSLVQSFGANVSKKLSVETPELGHLYCFRLFAAQTGSPNGDGNLIDELNIPRLKSGMRRQYLTMCTEGAPQLAIESGGTFIRANLGSGSVVTRALFFVSDKEPNWPNGEFPVLLGATASNFLLSVASDTTDLFHEVVVVDLRADGWPDSRRLGPDMKVYFVALVWDSGGGFDFTWTTDIGMPVGASVPPPAEAVMTKRRKITLKVTELVCLDDSDDLSDGEAEFKITLDPAAPGTRDTRDVSWKPMETGSILSLDQLFDLSGPEAESVSIAVRGTEDDESSFPISDEDDTAGASAKLTFRSGPGTETFNDVLTLDSQVGGDGFHYLMHCSVAVSYA